MLDPACILKHLDSLPPQAQIYIETHNHKNILRFTKLTATSWKHTDGFARPGSWITQQDLAKLGTPKTFQETHK